MQEHMLKKIMNDITKLKEMKSAIKIYLSTDVSVTTGQNQMAKVSFDTVEAQIGNKLTFEKNSVKIGQGVNHVKISACLCLNMQNEINGMSIGALIEKNDRDALRYQTLKSLATTTRERIDIISVIVDVQEGDTISLYARTVANPNHELKIRGSELDTNLYVEVLD